MSSLRRSVTGSLKRAMSPFSSPRLTSDSNTRSPSPSSIQSSRKLSSLQKDSVILKTIPENTQYSAPEHDRAVDLLVTIPPTKRAQEHPFDLLLGYSDATIIHDHILFRLPVQIRRQIYGNCFPDEHRRVSLSPRFATKQLFPKRHFASPWKILEHVWGGIQSFGELRYELLAYFWTRYHFFVAINPFTGPNFSPLSTVWLPEYLHIIQHLTVEIDLTRLGFSALRAAAQYGYNTRSSEAHFSDLINGIQSRETGPMKEFNLMCRRYAGMRPPTRSPVTGKDVLAEHKAVPYCREDAQYICDHYANLRDMLQLSRITGFSDHYTDVLFHAIFTENAIADYSCTEPSPWPNMVPAQLTHETVGPSFHGDSIASAQAPQLELSSCPSFSQDIKDGMRICEALDSSARTFVPDYTSINRTLAEESKPFFPPQVARNFASVVSKASFDVSSQSSPVLRRSESSQRHLLAASPSYETPTTPDRDCCPPSDELSNTFSPNCNYVFHPRIDPKSSPGAVVLRSSPETQTPHMETTATELKPAVLSGVSRTTPPGTGDQIEMMNKQNEQDPAFKKTVEALRSHGGDMTHMITPNAVDSSTTVPATKIPSPKSGMQGVAHARTDNGVKRQHIGGLKRYLSFAKRMRGHED